jgi:hypothetical protein
VQKTGACNANNANFGDTIYCMGNHLVMKDMGGSITILTDN